MSLSEYTFLAASSMFVIVDPISTVPAFLAMTPDDTAAERARMARLACWLAAGVLLAFAFLGKWIFRFLGISMPAFQMAGSIVLLLVAVDMLKARRSPVQETKEEKVAGVEKADIAITPLGVPMLAGPGAISTAILLHSQANSFAQDVALAVCIAGVMFVSYWVFRISTLRANWLNPIAMKITTRIMGLLLAAVAVQFMMNAFVEFRKTL
jgi:multiple antibiotic resistance protein